jgi:hypothetical protein
LKTQLLSLAKDLGIYLLLCVATFLMAHTIAQYFTGDEHVAFLQYKQDYLHIPLWRFAFYTHVFSSILTLLAGFTQFSKLILREQAKLHRYAGRVYVFAILCVNFPTGLVLAVYANGHWPAKLAFVMLDVLWFAFTLKGLLAIRRKEVNTHNDYMIRSYALTCSAVTLRSWKLILSALLVISPLSLYQIDAWLGFVPNLLFAEWLIRRRRKRTLLPAQ